METLPFTTIQGTPSEIGEALGRLAQPAMAEHIVHSRAWQALQPWRGHEHVGQLMAATQDKLPDCWEELEGMARGTGMDVGDLFLWNCRTDLLEQFPDSSVSIAANRLANGMVGHNVNGERALLGRCHVVDIAPRGKPGFIGFYCPGSLPGRTFAASRAGLVQVMDALRAQPGESGLPTFALCRAMLDATSLPDAIETLVENPRAGGLHQIIGWAGEFIMTSVEATPQTRSLVPIARSYGHANHAIHEASQARPAVPSSLKRLARASELLAALSEFPEDEELFRVLCDRDGGPGHRIHDDAQDETTLASAVLRYTPTEIRLQIRGSDCRRVQRHRIPIAHR